MKKELTFILLISLCISFLFISGCTSDTNYSNPSKVETITTEQQMMTNTQEDLAIQPNISIFKIGEAVTDDELQITLNAVRFVSKIDEQDNEYLIAEAEPDKQYVLVDITIENILSNKTQSVSSLFQTMITDDEGYNYDLDFNGLIALDRGFKDGEILPGMKKRGELPYLVPLNSKKLNFIFKFDLIGGKSAVFNIK